MPKVEIKTQKKFKLFTFNSRVSSYCDHKRIRVLTLASVHVYRTKCNLKKIGQL